MTPGELRAMVAEVLERMGLIPDIRVRQMRRPVRAPDSGRPGVVPRAYRALLRWAWPEELFASHGAPAVELFGELQADARRRGPTALLAFWMRCFRGVLGSRRRPGGPGPARRTGDPSPTPAGPGRPGRSGAFLDDLRAATRQVSCRPGFLALGAGALGAGLAAAILVFGLVNTLLLRPAPGVSNPRALVEIGHVDDDGRFSTASFPDFVDLRDGSESIEEIFAYQLAPAYLDVADRPVSELAMLVSGEYFETLGVEAAHGRLIGPDQDAAPGREPVVVLGHEAFERHFQGDPAAIGSVLRINGTRYVVQGVTAPAFEGHLAAFEPGVFVPLSMAGAMQVRDDSARSDRGDNWVELAGRLAEGATLEQARAELEALSAALSELRPAGADPVRFDAAPLGPVWQRVRGVLGFLAGGLMIMCGAVLALACSNLAGVLLAQGQARAGEMALRSALGAGRGRLVRQLVLESGLVALAAGGVGLLLAVLARDVLRLVPLPVPFPLELGIVIDFRVVLFALAASGLVALAFGLLPALRISAVAPGRALASGGGTGTAGPGRPGRLQGLLAVQAALTVALLLVALLNVRALAAAGAIDTGFRSEDVYTASLDMTPLGLRGQEAATPMERLTERLRRLPGVDAASFASILPLTMERLDYGAARRPGSSDQRVELDVNTVGEDFFDVFGIPVAGRAIEREHRADGPRVAVINASLARRVFGGRDPVGRELELGAGEDWRRVRVIGTVPDGRYASLTESGRAFAFLPASQWPRARYHLFVHGRIDVATLQRTLAAEVGTMLPGMPVPTVHAFADAAAFSTLPQRILGVVAAVLGGLALLLAATGLYGVLAFGIERRFRDLGVRRALGASTGRMALALARRTGAWLVGGVLAGLLLAQLAVAGLGDLLFGVQGGDPLAVGGALLAVALTAAVAIAGPLRRAMRVDPMEALRRD